MADETPPRPPGPDDAEPVRALLREPRVREMLADALLEELESRRERSPWPRAQPWLAGAASALVTVMAFFLPSLQEQWDRAQSRHVIQRYVELGRDFLDAGRYRLAEETFAKAFELSENRRLDIEELRLQARVGQMSADPTWGRGNPVGLHESDFLYLLQLQARDGHPRSRAATLNSYGLFLIGAHRPREAEDAFREAAALDSTNDAAHVHLGNLYGDLGRVRDAEREYRRAIGLDSLDAVPRYDLALLLEPTGREPEALDQLARAAALDPDDADLLGEYARALERAGHADEARAVRARRAQLPPPPPAEEQAAGEETPG